MREVGKGTKNIPVQDRYRVQYKQREEWGKYMICSVQSEWILNMELVPGNKNVTKKWGR